MGWCVSEGVCVCGLCLSMAGGLCIHVVIHQVSGLWCVGVLGHSSMFVRVNMRPLQYVFY